MLDCFLEAFFLAALLGVTVAPPLAALALVVLTPKMATMARSALIDIFAVARTGNPLSYACGVS